MTGKSIFFTGVFISLLFLNFSSVQAQRIVFDSRDPESEYNEKKLPKCPTKNKLFEALRTGKNTLALQLIQSDVDLFYIDCHKRTSLTYALIFGHYDIALKLIERGVNLNQVDHKGWNSLLISLRYGNPKISKLLISKGVDVHAVRAIAFKSQLG